MLSKKPYSNKSYAKITNETVSLFNDLLHCGKILLKQATKEDKLNTDADKILLLWFNETLNILQGTIVLFQKQQFNNSLILCRTLMENYMNFLFAFEKEDEVQERLLAYRFFELIKELHELSRTDKNNIYPSKNLNKQRLPFDITPIIDGIKEQICSETYANLYNKAISDFDYDFDNLKNNLVKRKWYTLFDKTLYSFRELCKHFNQEDEYIAFYSKYSKKIHANDSLNGFCINADGSIELKTSTYPEDMSTPLYHLVLMITTIYKYFSKYFSLKNNLDADKYKRFSEKLSDLLNNWDKFIYNMKSNKKKHFFNQTIYYST